MKNDEVDQVEKLLESEKVENQSSELLSDTLIVEGANDKEEDRVEAVVSEQPDSIPHQNVEISPVEPMNVETESVVTPINDAATPHGFPMYIDNSVTESVATPLEKDSIQAGETEIAEPTSSESTNVEAASVDNSEIHADTSLTAVSSVNLDNPVIEPVAIPLIGSKRDTNAEVEVSSLSKREVRKPNTEGLISVQSKVIKKELLESSLVEAGSPLLEATIAQSSNSNSTEIGMSYQNTVLLESNNTERQVSKAEIVIEHKETELVETVSSASEPVVLVENISQTSNNTIESGKNMGVQSQAGAKQILGIEQSSKVSTPTSRQIMGVGLLTLVLGSALGLLKKRRK